MTGIAQAGGGSDHELGDTARQVTGTVERVVDREVRRPAPADKVRQQHRAPVANVTRTVRHRVDPVVSPVVAPVASVAKQTVENTVKPVTTRTTDTVRSAVSKVANDVRSGLEDSPAGAVDPARAGARRARGRRRRCWRILNRARGNSLERVPAASTSEQRHRCCRSQVLWHDLGTVASATDADPNSAASSGQDTAVADPSRWRAQRRRSEPRRPRRSLRCSVQQRWRPACRPARRGARDRALRDQDFDLSSADGFLPDRRTRLVRRLTEGGPALDSGRTTLWPSGPHQTNLSQGAASCVHPYAERCARLR